MGKGGLCYFRHIMLHKRVSKMVKETLTQALLQKALDGTWQRQKAIANNIANHETPGYKSISVEFEHALKNELNRAGSSVPDKIRNAKITSHTNSDLSYRADGNNVDIDKESIDLVKTQIQYQYLTRSLTDYYARLRYAISEGKR